MADDFGWQQILQDSIDEMFRAVKQREAFTYDVILPGLMQLQEPATRAQFYRALDMDSVKAESPELWARLTDDALNIAQSQQKQQQTALDKLDDLERKQDAAFRYQVTQRPVLGLRSSGAPQLSTNAQGLNTTLPLGMLGRGM